MGARGVVFTVAYKIRASATSTQCSSHAAWCRPCASPDDATYSEDQAHGCRTAGISRPMFLLILSRCALLGLKTVVIFSCRVRPDQPLPHRHTTGPHTYTHKDDRCLVLLIYLGQTSRRTSAASARTATGARRRPRLRPPAHAPAPARPPSVRPASFAHVPAPYRSPHVHTRGRTDTSLPVPPPTLRPHRRPRRRLPSWNARASGSTGRAQHPRLPPPRPLLHVDPPPK